MYQPIFLFILVLKLSAGFIRLAPKVTTSQGDLIGKQNGGVYEYLGIPYAKVNERFKGPGDAPKWNGVLEAVHIGSQCAQQDQNLNINIGSENCLNLNVYTPDTAVRSSRLPVMVFIHGGGFYWGSGGPNLYHPKYLVNRGVILVTINYRLGALGFLCLDIKEAPGNAGLKDMLAALRWVKKNIMGFGGDEDNVTIFGQSAGSAAVSLLILSPLSQGLFQRAIMESGTATTPWAYTDDPIARASLAAELLGYKSDDPKELYRFFLTASRSDLAKVSAEKEIPGKYIFAPCAEKSFPDVESLINDAPINIIKSGNYTKIPLIVGFNNMEGIYYAGGQSLPEIRNTKTEKYFPSNLNITNSVQLELVTNDVNKKYFRDYQADNTSNSLLNGLIELASDIFFRYPSSLFTKYYTQDTNLSVYNYYFKYDGHRNFNKVKSGLPYYSGAAHGDELFYLFNPLPWIFRPDARDNRMLKRMTTMWTNFAKVGNPTPEISKLLPIKWPLADSNLSKILSIDDTLSVEDLPNRDHIEYWNDVYEKFGYKI